MPALTRRDLLAVLAAVGACALAGLRLAQAGEAERIKFSELYGARMSFTDKVKSLAGKPVMMRGFMAPPLKPDWTFFVLTKLPLTVCPFCNDEAEWPDDIVVVRLGRPFEAVRFNQRLEVQGILEVGSDIDEDTGFVSLLRIVDAEFEPV
jgi:hypothetical protein